MPTFEECMLPILNFIGSRKVSSKSDIVKNAIKIFDLSEEEKNERLSKSGQLKIYSKVSWAISYLLRAELINREERGSYSVTESGQDLLNQNLKSIDKKFLYGKYLSFREYMDSSKIGKQKSLLDITSDKKSPDEQLDEAYKLLQHEVLRELLDQIKNISPEAFERLILELLKKIGYGGFDGKGIKGTSKSGDEGIDGEINQDRLGLDRIYMQAKRYKDSVVGRPEIQKFVGALSSKKSKRGLFITTSKFSETAKKYIKEINYRIVLVDGEKFAKLLYDHNLGVKIKSIFEYKEVDNNFF